MPFSCCFDCIFYVTCNSLYNLYVSLWSPSKEIIGFSVKYRTCRLYQHNHSQRANSQLKGSGTMTSHCLYFILEYLVICVYVSDLTLPWELIVLILLYKQAEAERFLSMTRGLCLLSWLQVIQNGKRSRVKQTTFQFQQ